MVGFNSLQTGKRIARRTVAPRTTKRIVSIPFKRESVSQVLNFAVIILISILVSIPFKRESVSQAFYFHPATTNYEFQFPSNGKAYRKLGNPSTPKEVKEFQFPSNGKAYRKSRLLGRLRSALSFQFPSNGKAYRKQLTNYREHADRIGFNSLQTGKRIARKGSK